MCMHNTAYSGDVDILAAEFQHRGDNHWSVKVTLEHDDQGWNHYADKWRVVDGKGKVIGNRVLHHPHVDEQPFTRSLDDITIANATSIVYIEAHDKVHGWTRKRLKIDLRNSTNGRLIVETN